MSATVLIFAKSPRIGLAKTRLARGVGKAQAQRLARMCFSRTLRAARDPRWNTILYAAPDRDLSAGFGTLWPRALERRSQGPGDLGARLGRGYREAPMGSRVIFIGADAPDVTKTLLWTAIKALGKHHAVVGPASDGGFWLLGLKRARDARHPFKNIRWSSRYTLADVEANFPEGAKVARLPTLIDLDEVEDWRAWAIMRRR
ncbi:MAG: TIGR04282 family arsenosugar biosynthesis glycosyltransferase [Pseudomonadota bacterium]